ncbi:hypothetical protein D082_11070 [Synechocystis sp. PCC 6714]|nr:hypothetical protein D082_11070 [Synechocystis sp. PCC 6714]
MTIIYHQNFFRCQGYWSITIVFIQFNELRHQSFKNFRYQS